MEQERGAWNIKERAAKITAQASVWMLMLRLEKKVTRNIRPQFVPNAQKFEDSFLAAIGETDTVPIIISNHQSHTDGIPLSVVADTLTHLGNRARPPDQPLLGFVLPVAASLETGHQSRFLAQGLEQIQPQLRKRQLITLSYTRQKDRQRYGIQSSNISFMRNLIRGLKNGYGLALLPEASVEGGRRGLNGIHGMQEFSGVDFGQVFEILGRLGKKALFIPIGIDGGYNVVDPNTNKLTARFIRALATPLDFSFIDVNIGMPVSGDTLLDRDQKNISHLLAERVAALVPEQARGVYKSV